MTRFEQILHKMGEDITWHKRQEGPIDPETGDRVVTWTMESIKAIVQQVSAGEVLVEAGYTDEDYIRIYVTVDVKQKDKVTCRNEDYEVLVPEAFHFRGLFEYRTALCRRLVA